jgi:hypothetical protein
VLGYGWPANVHTVGEFSDGTRPLSQSFENEPARGIAERIEDRSAWAVSITLQAPDIQAICE